MKKVSVNNTQPRREGNAAFFADCAPYAILRKRCSIYWNFFAPAPFQSGVISWTKNLIFLGGSDFDIADHQCGPGWPRDPRPRHFRGHACRLHR
jgi:hypothetical protein